MHQPANVPPTMFSISVNDAHVTVVGDLDIRSAPVLVACGDLVQPSERGIVVVDIAEVPFCDVAGIRALEALGPPDSVEVHGARPFLQRLLTQFTALRVMDAVSDGDGRVAARPQHVS